MGYFQPQPIAVNPWNILLYAGALEVSKPEVQWNDGQYRLHTSLRKYSGSVTMEWEMKDLKENTLTRVQLQIVVGGMVLWSREWVVADGDISDTAVMVGNFRTTSILPLGGPATLEGRLQVVDDEGTEHWSSWDRETIVTPVAKGLAPTLGAIVAGWDRFSIPVELNADDGGGEFTGVSLRWTDGVGGNTDVNYPIQASEIYQLRNQYHGDRTYTFSAAALNSAGATERTADQTSQLLAMPMIVFDDPAATNFRLRDFLGVESPVVTLNFSTSNSAFVWGGQQFNAVEAFQLSERMETAGSATTYDSDLLSWAEIPAGGISPFYDYQYFDDAPWGYWFKARGRTLIRSSNSINILRTGDNAETDAFLWPPQENLPRLPNTADILAVSPDGNIRFRWRNYFGNNSDFDGIDDIDIQCQTKLPSEADWSTTQYFGSGTNGRFGALAAGTLYNCRMRAVFRDANLVVTRVSRAVETDVTTQGTPPPSQGQFGEGFGEGFA